MNDARALVARGYDQIGERYLERYGSLTVRTRWLAELLRRLPKRDARIVDLGCGAGVPVVRDLAAAGHDVLGLDGSARQIALARENVPAAKFMQADMTAIEFPPDTFDAVVAFYSMTHVPRSEHEALLRRIAGWLKPGGSFVASMGASAVSDWQGSWLGTQMFFSHFDADTNLGLVQAAGLTICRSEVLSEDTEDARFCWVLAEKAAREAT